MLTSKIHFLILNLFLVICLSNSQLNYTINWNNMMGYGNSNYILTPLSRVFKINISSTFQFDLPVGTNLLNYQVGSVPISNQRVTEYIDLSLYNNGERTLNFTLIPNVTIPVLNPSFIYNFQKLIDSNRPPVVGLNESCAEVMDSPRSCQVFYIFNSSTGDGNTYSLLKGDNLQTMMLQPDLYYVNIITSTCSPTKTIGNLANSESSQDSAGKHCPAYSVNNFAEEDFISMISVPSQPFKIILFKTVELFSRVSLRKAGDYELDRLLNLRQVSGDNVYLFTSNSTDDQVEVRAPPILGTTLYVNNSKPLPPIALDFTSVNGSLLVGTPSIINNPGHSLVDLSFSYQMDVYISNYQRVAYFTYSCNGRVFKVDRHITQSQYSKRINIPFIILAENSFSCQLDVIAKGDQIVPTTLLSKSISLSSSGIGSSSQIFITDYSNGTIQINLFNDPTWKSLFKPICNINTQYVNSSTSLPSRLPIVREYPYYFKGNYKRFSYNGKSQFFYEKSVPLIPIKFISPGLVVNYTLGNANFNGNPIDFVNPFGKVQVGFNKDYTNVTFSVNITDTGVGILENSCFISIGPQKFTLNSTNRIQGDQYSGIYYVVSYYNPAYCYEPINLNCSDKYGNSLVINTTSPFSYILFNYTTPSLCTISTDIRPIFSSIKFRSPMELSYSIVIYYGSSTAPPVGRISLADNLYGNMISRTDSLVKIDDNERGLAVYSVNYTFSNIESTTTFYPSISFNSTGVSYTTLDLIYFLNEEISLMNPEAIPTISFTIKPTDLKLFPKPILIVTQSTISLTIPASDSLISYIGFVALNNYFPDIQRFTWTLASGDNSKSAKNVTLTIPNYQSTLKYFVYIEEICDTLSNCEQLPAYGISSNQLKLPESTDPDSILTAKIDYTKNIDTSKSNRTFSAKVTVTPGIIDPPPILYLVSSNNVDMIQCQTVFIDNSQGKSSSTVGCSIVLPPGWSVGSNVSLSLHGAKYLNTINYIELSDVLTIAPFTGPKIWTAKYSFLTKTISITGYNLGLILGDGSAYPVKMGSNLLNFQMHSATSGIFSLNGTGFDPTTNFNITCNNVDYTVMIESCVSANCNGNGRCDLTVNKCICNNGWLGIACDIQNKTYNCGPNGELRAMTCQCKNNYTGPNCDVLNDIKVDMEVSRTRPKATFSSFEGNFGASSNRLQFKWSTAASQQSNNNTNNSNGNTTTDYGGSGMNDVHWTVLGTNNVQLFSRFNSKIILDGETLQISNKIMNTTSGSSSSSSSPSPTQVVVVTVPAFQQSLLMDPDFSTLTRFNTDSNNNHNNSGENDVVDYKVAIIVVVVVLAKNSDQQCSKKLCRKYSLYSSSSANKVSQFQANQIQIQQIQKK
ncbi:hypothetical protein PPL_04448 [Heterostelium album PN500]|uniref:EGF-like domain-containing protein n=1 Tax=Heterostelium pallidum (strain ATCC 26659 / Pp 5 / PN500) TaxID=670386 RepID=D3B7L0_HETP5|nr:hypothetical protein PPL_04448 [Heterostelium album PN500]EFA82753.1 hypothetical protein PPL_04448 [Heterostelium album PN500]|eukprot:XP_020434870.1 hypothetical protein PPL_04448 [Heterostelium album PN500]